MIPEPVLPNKIAMMVLFSSVTENKIRDTFYRSLNEVKKVIDIVEFNLDYMYGTYKSKDEITQYVLEKEIYEEY